MAGNSPNDESRARPRYVWPWFILAGFVLAVLLVVLWMSAEIRRTKMIRDLNAPTYQPKTNLDSRPKS